MRARPWRVLCTEIPGCVGRSGAVLTPRSLRARSRPAPRPDAISTEVVVDARCGPPSAGRALGDRLVSRAARLTSATVMQASDLLDARRQHAGLPLFAREPTEVSPCSNQNGHDVPHCEPRERHRLAAIASAAQADLSASLVLTLGSMG